MVYEKLVRDLIPDLIAAQGEKPNIRILDDAEYRECLSRKLDEEVQEFHKENNLEELADILEVVYALAEINGGREKLERIYAQKHEARGGFSKRIFLISKE
jgi:predicted house-cleaning noncanonical NTP pyrophosphatase (MazG superfamily)